MVITTQIRIAMIKGHIKDSCIFRASAILSAYLEYSVI